MRRSVFLGLIAFGGLLTAQQTNEDSLDVYTEHPRLFVRPQRLRLLKRERERRSPRWSQFETLLIGGAPMPEMGFAQALYYQITGDAAAAKRAIAWALGPANDLRQLALVFDWCQGSITEAQARTLTAKMVKLIAASERDKSVAAARDRALAAVALYGHQSDVPARQLELVVRNWWNKEMVPGLRAGRDLIPRESLYALFELMHAVRDNTNVEMRDSFQGYFKGLPVFDLLSYYPPTFAAPEGEYRIPAVKGGGEPDVARATMARAAEFIMVAYDTNAQESQVLQGWLMHDNYLLRGMLGCVYELLWANPYQPGLSYYHVPLLFHDDLFGRLFVRSSWEENSKWLAYFGDELQVFEGGKPTVVNVQGASEPVDMGEAIVLTANYARKFKITIEDNEPVFVIALKPRQAYEIEVDDEEMREQITDPGGILMLQLPRKATVGVRMRESKN